jgi:hypothetical protein
MTSPRKKLAADLVKFRDSYAELFGELAPSGRTL